MTLDSVLLGEYEPRPSLSLIAELRVTPPVSRLEVEAIARKLHLRHRHVSPHGILRFSVPWSLFYRRMHFDLGKGERTPVIILRGRCLQAFALPLVEFFGLLSFVAFIALYLWRLLPAFIHGHEETWSLAPIWPILMFFFLAYLFHERRCYHLITRTFLREIGAERRFEGRHKVSVRDVRRESVAYFATYLVACSILLILPRSWGLLLCILGVIPLVFNYIAATQHSVCEHRLKRLHHWGDRLFDANVLFAFAALATATYILTAGFIQFMQAAPLTEPYLTPTPDFFADTLHYAYTHSTVAAWDHDLEHALSLVPLHPAMADILHGTRGTSSASFIVAPICVLFFGLGGAQAIYHAHRVLQMVPAPFVGVIPALQGRAYKWAVGLSILRSAVMTMIALWIAFVAIMMVYGPQIGSGLPGADLLFPLDAIARFSATAGYVNSSAILVLLAVYCIPAVLIAVDLSFGVLRYACSAWRAILPLGVSHHRIKELKAIWQDSFERAPFPRVCYDKRVAGGPEVRYIPIPPFRYVALPIWFRADVLSDVIGARGIAALLAHEDYHYTTGWCSKVLFQGITFLTTRCPDSAGMFVTGRDEFAADANAVQMLAERAPMAEAVKTLDHSVRCVASLAPRTAARKSTRGILSLLWPLRPGRSPLVNVSPSWTTRLRALRRLSLPGDGSHLSGAARVDCVIAVILALTVVGSFALAQEYLHNRAHIALSGDLEPALASPGTAYIRALHNDGDELYVLRQQSIVKGPLGHIDKVLELDNRCINPCCLATFGAKGILVGSGWRGAWAMLANSWEPLRFGGNSPPAVLGICAGERQLWLATSDGLWSVTPSTSLAASFIWGRGRICTDVGVGPDGVLVGTTKGLYLMRGPQTFEQCLEGHVTALDATASNWVAAIIARRESAFFRENRIVASDNTETTLREIARSSGSPDRITALLVSDIHETWVGTSRGVWSHSAVTNVSNGKWIALGDGRSSPDVTAMQQVSKQIVLADRTTIKRIENESLIPVPFQEPLPPVAAMSVDFKGVVWIAASGQTWRYDGDAWIRVYAGTPEAVSLIRQPLFVGSRTESGVVLIAGHDLVKCSGSGSIERIGLPHCDERNKVTAIALTENDCPVLLFSNGAIQSLESGEWRHVCNLPFRALQGGVISCRNGTIWYAAAECLGHVDSQTGHYASIKTQALVPVSIVPMSDEECLVFYANGAIVKISRNQSRVRRVASPDGCIIDARSWSRGGVVIATRFPTYVYELTIMGKLLKQFGPKDGLPRDIDKLVVDQHSCIWVVDDDGGLWRERRASLRSELSPSEGSGR